MSAYGDIAAMATLLGGRDPDNTESPGPSGAPFNPGALPVAKDDGVAIPAVRPGKKDAKAIWDVSELVDDFDDDSSEEGEDGSGLRIDVRVHVQAGDQHRGRLPGHGAQQGPRLALV